MLGGGFRTSFVGLQLFYAVERAGTAGVEAAERGHDSSPAGVLSVVFTCGHCAVHGLQTQSRKLLTYFFSFGAFAALAKAFAGDEFGQNPRGCGLNSGWATPLAIF